MNIMNGQPLGQYTPVMNYQQPATPGMWQSGVSHQQSFSQMNVQTHSAQKPIPPRGPRAQKPPSLLPQHQPAHTHITAPKHSTSRPTSVATPTASESFFCDPCDKEFTQKSAYDAHMNSHEMCQYEGCTFSASKKVVVAHYHSTHGTYSGSGFKMIDVEGQRFRVLLGTDPSEVEQWRLDRRKKFPSKENVKDKLTNLSRLKEAGGVLSRQQKMANKRARGEDGALDLEDSENSAARIEDEVNGDDTDINAKSKTIQSAVNSGRKSLKYCTFFANGRCKDGDQCKFNHDFEPKICQYFLKGHCKRGSKCSYMHDRELQKQHREERRDAKRPATAANDKSHSKEASPNTHDTVDGISKLDGGEDICNQNGHDLETSTALNEDAQPKETKDTPTSLSSPSAASSESGTAMRLTTPSPHAKANDLGRDADAVLSAGSRQNASIDNKHRSTKRPHGDVRSREVDEKEIERSKRAKAQRTGQLYLPPPLQGGQRGTLLKNLLTNEIHKEENFILQCFRYMIQNQFLQQVGGTGPLNVDGEAGDGVEDLT